MKITPYVSIDIETTGLDPEWCQVLEVAAVIDNGGPIDELPTFSMRVRHDRITGQPIGLAMNAELLRLMNTGYEPVEVGWRLSEFLKRNGIDPKNVTAAGKNFAAFDRQFLVRLPEFNQYVHFKHRSIDPAMFYWRPETDTCLPSTAECLERAGINKTVAHRALDDALDVVRLIRHAVQSR